MESPIFANRKEGETGLGDTEPGWIHSKFRMLPADGYLCGRGSSGFTGAQYDDIGPGVFAKVPFALPILMCAAMHKKMITG